MDRILNISELTSLIKNVLETQFGDIFCEGEISNFRPSSSGHVYFTLKDSSSMIQAVIFKNRHKMLSFEPTDGMFVRVKGSISVYGPRGTYQIICETIEKAGIGDILEMLEARKRKLAALGLFDLDRKKQLPDFPDKIGVITSPTGAAIRDIVNVVRRRNIHLSVLILPVPVQGAEAAPAIVRQIECANKYNLVDVLIIGRGGGSIEDLLPFSDEAVVKAIAASTIPVVSAVGHEIDWALSDFVADLRAPTPSAAAELVTQNLENILERIEGSSSTIQNIMKYKIEKINLILEKFSPESLELQFRKIEQPYLNRYEDAKENLIYHFRDIVSKTLHSIERFETDFEARSPLSILSRGYSVLTNAKGNVIKNSNDTTINEKLSIRLFNGSIQAEVKEIIHEEI